MKNAIGNLVLMICVCFVDSARKFYGISESSRMFSKKTQKIIKSGHGKSISGTKCMVIRPKTFLK